MTNCDHSESKQGLGKQRIEALSDGVFAIAMTLLVLDIKVPGFSEGALAPEFLTKTLLALWPKFLTFGMSFVILGLFWIAHQGYAHFLKRTDRYFLWINLLFLMVVVTVPFSTALLGSYPNYRLAAMIYGINILALGVTLLWQWSYATSGHRLVSNGIEPELVKAGKQRIMFGIGANLIAVLLALVNPSFSLVLYVLFPFVYLRPSHIDRHWTHAH
jgi:uncharacterized membrane protein